MKQFILPIGIGIVLMLAACVPEKANEPSTRESTEIFYHVFQRSFYDSNGDLHGDLPGLEQKLEYLQELGITSILLLPLYESEYYHNYFPVDFKRIDPEFGTEEDYLSLVQAAHRRGMKIYMDMEIQYITEDHLWYKDAVGNPNSAYSDYILFNGPDNTEPESIIFNLKELEGYDGTKKKVATLNLYDEKLKKYIYDLFAYWVDPNGDGNFEDGVDGFRIDHMMDDLDHKGKITDMHQNYWKPLFDSLRSINPQVKIVGEQANWFKYAEDYFIVADLDYLFAFAIKFGITSLDKNKIQSAVDSTFMFTPEGKDQFIFIENHDTHRFASEVNGEPGLLQVGASLNLLLRGIPILYYGQEIGMKGEGGFGKYGMTDANDIPRREAFEWRSTVDNPGMAYWYKDSGPWWEESTLKDHDGISYEEQKSDPGSLWNWYKKLIEFRKTFPALGQGDLVFLENENPAVVSFLRSTQDQALLVHINLSGDDQNLSIRTEAFSAKSPISLTAIIGSKADPMEGKYNFPLSAYETSIWEVK